MSYREDQRRKATAMRDALFRDPGDGLFSKKEREFVLQDATLNLWAGIRDDAIEYFKENSIAWWMGDENTEPTGHLLSSQVACLNYLYFVRQRKDAATAILKNICGGIDQAVTVDNGFVEFEVIGSRNYLNERSHTRGANATSVDAVMIGEKKPGSKVLVLIEWKYTEESGKGAILIDDYIGILDKTGWQHTHIIQAPMSAQRFSVVVVSAMQKKRILGVTSRYVIILKQ